MIMNINKTNNVYISGLSSLFRCLAIEQRNRSDVSLYMQQCQCCSTSQKKPFDYRDYNYKIVKVSETTRLRSVPTNITYPKYVNSSWPSPLGLKGIDIKTKEDLTNIVQACKVARKVLDHTASLIKVINHLITLYAKCC